MQIVPRYKYVRSVNECVTYINTEASRTIKRTRKKNVKIGSFGFAFTLSQKEDFLRNNEREKSHASSDRARFKSNGFCGSFLSIIIFFIDVHLLNECYFGGVGFKFMSISNRGRLFSWSGRERKSWEVLLTEV